MTKETANKIGGAITSILAVIEAANLIMTIFHQRPTLYYRITKGILIECDYNYKLGLSKKEILKPLDDIKRFIDKQLYRNSKEFDELKLELNNI